MAKKNEESKKQTATGKSANESKKSVSVNLSKTRKKDTDDTGPRNKK